jgi:microcompartment protein CcmK/EutM
MADVDNAAPGKCTSVANDVRSFGAYRSAHSKNSTKNGNGDNGMQLARVRGNVVASIKAAGLASHKLLLLEPVSAAAPQAQVPGADASSVYVAIDLAGAGVGEVVLVARGSAARVDRDGQAAPTDAAVVAIVDYVQFDGQTTFQKR